MQKYRLNNWTAFDGKAIEAAFDNDTEATLCAAAAGAQLYKITETGAASLIYWPGMDTGGGADGTAAEE